MVLLDDNFGACIFYNKIKSAVCLNTNNHYIDFYCKLYRNIFCS